MSVLIRAISTQEGLVISLNKHAILAIKNGSTVDLDLVSNGKKVHVMLMRDHTYKSKQLELRKLTEKEIERQNDIINLAKGL